MQNSRHKLTIASLMIAIFILGLGYLVYAMMFSPVNEGVGQFSSSTPISHVLVPNQTGQPASSTASSTNGGIDDADKNKITYRNATTNNIVVELPFPGAVVGKEFSVIGKARGTWYFEATFPVDLLDKNNKVIASGMGQAQGDWMTEEFVKFKADIRVPQSYIGPATLVLKKDNPSGLPQHDASISFPITVEY